MGTREPILTDKPLSELMDADERRNFIEYTSKLPQIQEPSVEVYVPNGKVTKSKPRWISEQICRWQTISNILIVFALVSYKMLYDLGRLPEMKLGFFCADPMFSYTYNGDLIPEKVLHIICNFLIVHVALGTELAISGSLRKINTYALWIYLRLTVIGTFMMVITFTFAKHIVGEHRPDFFDICQPDTGKNCTAGTYVSDYECTNTKFSKSFMRNASKSFPSGHAATSIYAAIVSLYIIWARLPDHRTGCGIRVMLIIICSGWVLIASLSRITDRRHHWWDIVAGLVHGAACGVFTIYSMHKKISKLKE